jgi:hypothetical protein
LFDFAFEGIKLYLALSFLAWVTAVPHVVAHWAFVALVSLVCMPGMIARVSRPRAGQLQADRG